MFTKKRKTIFIHIGFMKTGTSSIQSFLMQNDKFLNQNGFYYPDVNKRAMNYLGFSLMNEIPPFVHHKLNVGAKELYHELNKEINKCSQSNILISSEAFSLVSTDYFLGDKAPNLLKKYLNKKNYDFKIIASIRRQDSYLESQYNQHIKTHNFYNLFDGNEEEFYRQKSELFDFNKVLKRWESVFGQENIALNIYSKNKDSVSEFLNLLKIETGSIPNWKKTDVNPKLSEKALEFMKIANGYEVIKTTAKQNYLLVDLIEMALAKQHICDNENRVKNKAFDKRALIEKIKSDVNEGNELLSKKNFGGDTSWYKEKIDLKLEKSDNRLSTEEAVQVAVAIWNHFNGIKNE